MVIFFYLFSCNYKFNIDFYNYSLIVQLRVFTPSPFIADRFPFKKLVNKYVFLIKCTQLSIHLN